MSRLPLVLQIQAFPQHMQPNGHLLDAAWMPFFASQEGPLRLITRTKRFDLHQPKQQLEQLVRPLDRRTAAFAALAQAIDAIPEGQEDLDPHLLDGAISALPSDERQLLEQLIGSQKRDELRTWHRALDTLAQTLWRRPWMKEYSQMYAVLMSQVPLRGLEHYLLAWLPKGLDALSMQAMVEQSFQTSAQRVGLPSLIEGAYSEQYDHLAPKEPHLPLIALLASYEFKGEWGAGDVLHRLLRSDMDIAIAVDIEAISRSRAEFDIDFAVKSRTIALQDATLHRDVGAEQKLKAAMEIQEVLDSQALHSVQLVVAVFGHTRQELDMHIHTLQGACGARLKLLRAKGSQRALLSYFSVSARDEIDAYTQPVRMPSAGVATMVPYGLRKPDRTDGILWLFDGDTPIFFDPFKDRRPAHAIVLGKTGSGKSFGMNLLLMRHATLGRRVIVFEPQGPPSRRLVAAAGHGGMRYLLDMRQQINVLDVVAVADETGRPPSIGAQVSHVTSQLGVLLGTSAQTQEGSTVFTARSFTSDEQAILALALEQLYKPYDLASLEPEATPILRDLVAILQQMANEHPDLYQPEASNLARSIRLRLTEGPLASTFNAPTSIDWDFDTYDINAFDFSSIPPEFVVFYYGQAFGAVNRYVRDPTRSHARETIVVIDEFKFMAQVPALVTFARNAMKTWRTFGCALWTADQDAETYIGRDADSQMRMIFDNAPIKLIGLQDIASAEMLQETVQGLTPAHADEITRLSRGSFVVVWDGDTDASRYKEVFLGRIEPTDAELRAFAGT
jgi:hypothetical protein